MKVLLVPCFTKDNPYQLCLAEGLKKYGVDVILVSDIKGRLPLLKAVKLYGRPDIVHLQWIHGFIVSSGIIKTIVKGFRFILELVILKLKGIKLIHTVHNLLHHDRKHVLLELLFRSIATRLYDCIIVHCDYARRIIAKTYRLSERDLKKIAVIPHGNYIKSYENTVSRSEARRHLGLAEDEIVFVYVGRIRPYKGLPHLLRSFMRLTLPTARLIIAGKPSSDQLRRSIKDLAKRDPRIILKLEFIPNSQIQIYLNAADVVVLPYKNILTSGSVILAMSFGKPVIAPRLGCIPELIEDDVGGFLYDPKNINGLFEALTRAVQSRKRLPMLGKYNLNKIRRFNWMEIAKATLQLYRRCLWKEVRSTKTRTPV